MGFQSEKKITERVLERIASPEDLRQLAVHQLPGLAGELRDYLIDTVANVGGHFSSSLGVVELTIALHYVLNTPLDRIMWDTGHQTYPHKILTGRREALKRVRRFGGISGFPKREESIYDTYNTGHAGTAISQMLGEAVGRDLRNESYRTVAVVGDAAVASGNSLEALNHGGHIKTDCLVILNDNDMSISHNVGALNLYLNKIIVSPVYNSWKRFWYNLMLWLPVIGPALQIFARKVEKSTKDFFIPGSLFADFGFRYVGPIDGHDVVELVSVLRKVINMKGPILLHVLTQKGKGYEPAEQNPTMFHSVSVFNKQDGSFANKGGGTISYSDIVGETLTSLVADDPSIVAVTPAMIEGSGLRKLYDTYPTHVYDVGIAEQHAVAFSGGLATSGLKPFLCIYSTFLSRSISQLSQDVALVNLPVRIIIDRAGCVGPDGETHQGLSDMGTILSIPGIRLYAPATGAEVQAMIRLLASEQEGPIAIRFPKGVCQRSELEKPISLEEIARLQGPVQGSGNDLCILAVGSMWDYGLEAARKLESRGVGSTVVGIRWIRPLDFSWLETLLKKASSFIILEDAYIQTGISSYLLQGLQTDIRTRFLKSYGFPSEFIIHGSREELFLHYGLDPDSICEELGAKIITNQTDRSPRVARSG